MLAIAKLFADIAKALNLPVWVITHGVVIILTGSITWVGIKFYNSKNQKIESVPVILAAIDTLRMEVKEVKTEVTDLKLINKSGHDSIKSDIGKGFGKVQEALTKTNELNNQKFLFLNRNIEEKFALPDRWIDDLINRISATEKKNETPYRLTSIP